LLEVIDVNGLAAVLALASRHEHARKNADDRDDHEQFD